MHRTSAGGREEGNDLFSLSDGNKQELMLLNWSKEVSRENLGYTLETTFEQ